ncbi:Long-chain-alcohol O-fatty-acyltransferase [Sesamum angolense]|uniref:Long-chain-alcohol O-fatty-acyltransferase n=1 Tax=Sesamum angolense TaxID=2727404 RepID=A0AAE2BIV0_9LAMI|nr:Long-chain-alcohol O-fatty-acyltransferase [Sesamum angolense]
MSKKPAMVDPEFQALTQIWLTAIVSLIFCHQIAARIPTGASRLVSVLPVIYLFTTLPLRLSSIHLGAPTIFYLVWLGNFKLLLLSFNQGPLSATAFLRFISVGLLPIKSKQTPSPESSSDHKRPFLLLLKCGLLAVIVASYKYREFLHPYLIMALYCCHVYLGVELILAITALPAKALGVELEPQFDEPYLATSLQDFWGRRWNLMVTSILRPTVYHPVRRISTRILGRSSWALAPAILATFLVSGLMHEVIYYYMSRASPTWEVTWFFVLHGVCVAAEVALKKAVAGVGSCTGGFGTLTVGFVVVTGAWLFFPQVTRNGLDTRAINEYSIVAGFIGVQDEPRRLASRLVIKLGSSSSFSSSSRACSCSSS